MNQDLQRFLASIQNPDPAINAVWQTAEQFGAAAIKPLVPQLSSTDFEHVRRVKHALYRIVRSAGRPKATRDARAVETALIESLAQATPAARREVLWLLSEIGTSRAVKPIAAWLTDPDAREAARCALTRIPSSKATGALKAALRNAPPEFSPALAYSIAARSGKTVSPALSHNLN